MSNIYWYCSLSILGLLTAVYVINKKRNITEITTFVVFYLFATCITWIGEFIALGVFDGYAYKIGVFTDIWAQNLLAHLLLNSFLWPGAATLVAAYQFKYKGITAVTLVFILLEYLFKILGIYEQHWWNYSMSAIIVVIYLVVSRQWFIKMNKIRYGLVRNITLYFVAFVILHIPFPILILLRKQFYKVPWGNDYYLSSTQFIFTYQLFEVLLLIYFVCILKKWYFKLVPFIISFIGQCILAYMNILVFQDGWNLAYTLILYSICIITFILLNEYTLKPEKEIIKYVQ